MRSSGISLTWKGAVNTNLTILLWSAVLKSWTINLQGQGLSGRTLAELQRENFKGSRAGLIESDWERERETETHTHVRARAHTHTHTHTHTAPPTSLHRQRECEPCYVGLKHMCVCVCVCVCVCGGGGGWSLNMNNSDWGPFGYICTRQQK